MKELGVTKEMFNPKGFIDWYNGLVGFAVTVLAAIFGPYWYLFLAFFVLNGLDWFSGWYKARRLKVESSHVGLAGIVKKVWYWVIVALAFIVSAIAAKIGGQFTGADLSIFGFIGWLTLASLSVNELRSIVENLVEAGINVPGIFVKGLAVAEKLVKSRENNISPEEQVTRE